MTCERTKFEAWYDSLYKGIAYTLKDDMELAWLAALASQQTKEPTPQEAQIDPSRVPSDTGKNPAVVGLIGLDEVALEVIEEIRDPNSVHPICPQGDMITLSMSEFTAYNHRLVEALGGQKPVEDFDPCAPCCVKPVPAGLDALVRSLHLKLPMATQEDAIDFAHRLVAELKGQEPVGYLCQGILYTNVEEQPENSIPLYAAPVITAAVPGGWKLVGWLDGRGRFFYADDPMYKNRHEGMREVFAAAPEVKPLPATPKKLGGQDWDYLDHLINTTSPDALIAETTERDRLRAENEELMKSLAERSAELGYLATKLFKYEGDKK